MLSAALIVRDEERHLGACLRSIKDIVDEIVVVDTGSVDATVDIASGFGARIFHQAWHDDFAAARNYALAQCRGAWILYIDADERARPCTRSALVDTLAPPAIVGAYVTLHARSGYTGYRELRLFRNDPRIRFEGVMHETIWPGIRRYLEEEGGEIAASDLVLDHVGYDGADEHKLQRDLPLLQKALAADPEHIHCWYHLGKILKALGRPDEARRAWRRGVEAARRLPCLRPADSLPFIELIQDHIAAGESAVELIGEARRRFPANTQLRWLEGQSRIVAGELEAAIEVLANVAEDVRRGADDADFSYDPRQFSSRTYSAIAGCHHRLGRHAEARRLYERALKIEPDDLELLTKHRLCAHLEQRAAARSGQQRP